jgi:tetratricopeptide (TPR) repeat protein
MRDVFALETELAHDISLQIRATTSNNAPSAQRRPVNLRALDAYLQGNYYSGTGSGDEEMRKAQKYFQQAIDADPNFSRAYIGMAYSHYALLRSSTEDRTIRRASAEKAVALDPSSSDARRALGEMKSADWDWRGAEQEFRRAILLNPNDAQAHDGLCGVLDLRGPLDEGWNECQTAQGLDPDNDHLGYALEARGQYDRAIQSLVRWAERSPADAFNHYYLYRDYALTGRCNESAHELERSLTLLGHSDVADRIHHAFVTAGYRGALQQWAKDFENLHATNQFYLPRVIAEVYAQLGDNDRAFYWLEEGLKHHDRIGSYGGIQSIKVEHELDPLRSDPRYANLLRRMGLPQ